MMVRTSTKRRGKCPRVKMMVRRSAKRRGKCPRAKMMVRTSTKRRGKCPRAKQQKMIEDDTTHLFIMYEYENHPLFFQEEEEVEEEEGKWVKHYSSLHEILLVGEGDFSFSLCLANAFGSASNIVTTSLDNYDVVTKKYSQAKSNIQNLLKMGATVLDGVDATKMKLHTDLSMRRFDRIIFNFPHAGFHGKEGAIHLIRSHRSLVQGFFRNASQMLRPYGEVHVSHKTSAPYDRWNLEELASKCYLTLTERVSFEKADYPGYNNKRGDGARCDKPFCLGECSTFKFRVNTRKEKTASEANAFYTCGQSLMEITETLHNIPLGQTLEESQFGGSISFDGNDHLICYPRMNNTSSMQLMCGTPHENTRLFSRSNYSCSVRYQPDRTNARHSEGNHYSLSARHRGVTNALQVTRHFNHADTINISAEWEGCDVVTKKYSQAKSNIQNLLKMGATVLHGVDAAKMKLHTDLSMRRFDRIIFNFPHAGFHGKKDAIHLIRLHRNLVQSFFRNASRMLCPNGEVHVSHKTSAPYVRWNLEELASKWSLTLTECFNFEKADYPGYNNKRGDGAGCDRPFHLRECSSFKFRINTKKGKMASEAMASYLCGQSPLDITETQHTIPTGGTLDENQFGRARSVDGTDHLICYPQMSNPSSLQDLFGIPYVNTRISSTNYHLRSVRCGQMGHTIALPEIPGTQHWNLRHPGENDHSLSFHYRGVTVALPVMRGHFNHSDTIDVTSECWRTFGDYLLHNDEMFGRTDYDFRSAIQEFLTNGYETYMNERPEGIHGYVSCLQELHHLTILRLTLVLVFSREKSLF